MSLKRLKNNDNRPKLAKDTANENDTTRILWGRVKGAVGKAVNPFLSNERVRDDHPPMLPGGYHL